MILLKQGMLMLLVLLLLSQTDLDVSTVLATFSVINYIFKKIFEKLPTFGAEILIEKISEGSKV